MLDLMFDRWCSVASEVVSLLDLLGTVSGVDHTVLGLTVLAWGNSLGDLSTNIAMARYVHAKNVMSHFSHVWALVSHP